MGMHQGYLMLPFCICGMLSLNLPEDVLSEFLCADDIDLMSETIE